jgi:ferric-dicitrate binding protein FerR (iron transport regulator)
MNTSYKELYEKYISNMATEQEIRLLVSFINTSPSIQELLEQQILNSSSETSDAIRQRMYNHIRRRIHAEEKRRKAAVANVWRWMAAAVIVGAAFVFGRYYHIPVHEAQLPAEEWVITTDRGEKAGMTLPDGSRVWLNVASRLTVSSAYNKEERRLRLDGEAYFEVATDAAKPFVVDCSDISVEALGTTFSVKAYGEDATAYAVLVEGKVHVAMPEQEAEMKAGERVVFNKSTQEVFTEMVNPNYFTEWRKNRLRFENETFEEIAKNIARIYNIDYSFADESIKALTFTGTLNNNNLEAILSSITLTSYISCSLKNSSIIFRKDVGKKKFFME